MRQKFNNISSYEKNNNNNNNDERVVRVVLKKYTYDYIREKKIFKKSGDFKFSNHSEIFNICKTWGIYDRI